MKRKDFEYNFPAKAMEKFLGWQKPKEERDSSRMLVVHKDTGKIEHTDFKKITSYIGRDIWVNESALMRCRVQISVGGRHYWAVFANKIGKFQWSIYIEDVEPFLKYGDYFQLPDGMVCRVVGTSGYRVDVSVDADPDFAAYGTVPLWPNVVRPQDESDVTEYEPLYATVPGSMTMASAGVHFSEKLLAEFHLHRVCLHVAYGSRSAIEEEDIEDHAVVNEQYEVKEIPPQGKVVAVGTTTVRALEAAHATGKWSGSTNLFIRPPMKLNVVESLLTNFHLPGDSLFVLCSALAGRENLLRAYDEAISEQYDFGFFGDCMLIL